MEDTNNTPLTELEIEELLEQEVKKKILEDTEIRMRAFRVKEETSSDGIITYSVDFNKVRSVEDAEGYLTEDERNLYAQENESLIHYIANMYYVATSTIDFEEILSAASLGFVKALNAWNKLRQVKFSTFAAECMKNEIRSLYASESKRIKTVPLGWDDADYDDILINIPGDKDVEREVEEKYDEEERLNKIAALNDVIERYLTDKEQFLIKSYYGFGDFTKRNQVELARMFNVSQVAIKKSLDRAKSKLRTFLSEEYQIDNPF